ncbi:MAG: cyclic pyranopterin monophosphate synthase MoaC [Planctomycetes bacterium]|nr:cyclic pyranopterin monophosphate synthase MoaC [Planctomycetota bacterium]
MKSSSKLTHANDNGGAGMVDVGAKEVTARFAKAACDVVFSTEAFSEVLLGNAPKGAVIECSRLAGISATKRTSDLIIMCHPLPLDSVDIDIFPCPSGEPRMIVECSVSCHAKTGVEMEAMTGASVAALSIYDMTKALDKSISIENLRLLEKSGGKSGHFLAK